MAPDLDQGGTSREWAQVYLGPSVGWVVGPQQNILPITSAGSFTLDANVSLVNVNVAGAVTINLPAAAYPASGALAQPGLFIKNPIKIIDVGGNAAANPITINPNAGDTIMGLASIQITSNFGGFLLTPNPATRTWNLI
jgi:hypothetical protein